MPPRVPPHGGIFTEVTVGGDANASFACALWEDGFIVCWGYDGYGQSTPP